MAKKVIITEQEKAPSGIIINQITVNRVNRQILDIGKWRNALLSADMDRMTLLYDLYEDILLDGRLWDAIDRRIRAVTGSDITFQFQDGTESQELIELIDTEEFEFLLNEIMQAIFWGVSLVQLDFSSSLQTFSVPRKHIRTKSKTVAVMQNDIDGSISYADLQNVIEVVNKRDRFGLILRAAPYVIMMRGGISDWAQMVELFGMPQRIGKYSIYDQEARKQLEQAFLEQGAAASMVVPKETDVETATNAGSVNSSIYKDFMAELKEAMLVAVLSNTMTTLDGSSRSQSEVHQDVEDELNKHDLRFVQRVLNKKLKPILEARGFNIKGGSFVFPKGLKDLTVEELVSLCDVIEIPAYYIQEKYGIPQATEKDKLARKVQPATPEQPESDTDEPDKGGEPPEPPTPEKKTKKAESKEMKLYDKSGFWPSFFDFFVHARTWWSRASLNLADKSTSFTANINIDALFEQALKDIYRQYGINPDDMAPVSKPLFDISNSALQKGVESAFTAEFGKADPEFIDQFRTNTAVFAAFKSHAQQNDIVAQLVNSDGNIKSYYDFKKAVLGTSIKKDYNQNWLKTEYNMAVRSARMAEKWKRFERVKHLYPNLEFLESTATNKREEHLEWAGTILPIDHPWWNTHTPPVGWGCECSIRNTDKPVTTAPGWDSPVIPVFANNPGKTAEFINLKEHPMVKKACPNFGGCKTRLNLADKPTNPECMICLWVKAQNLTWEKKIMLSKKEAEAVIKDWVKTVERVVESKALKTRLMKLSGKSIDRYVGHGRNAEEKLIITTLPDNIEKLKNPKYTKLGVGKDLSNPIDAKNVVNKRKRGVTGYNVYEYEYNGKWWAVGMEVINNGQYEQPYFIKPLKRKKT